MRSGTAVFPLLVLIAACGDLGTGPRRLAKFREVAAGVEHTCAVTSDGRAVCWGRGALGELGSGATGSATPVLVASSETFTTIRVGRYHTCALSAAGRAICWGGNGVGQLGRGGEGPDAGAPEPVAGSSVFVELSAGWFHTCGLDADGVAWCWGANGQGQLGDGSRVDRSIPVRVASTLRFRALAAGGYHTCGVALNGRAYCWGLNQLGQLGTDATNGTATPIAARSSVTFRAISAGFAHTCAIATRGSTYCWGSNGNGELGNRAIESGDLPGATRPSPVWTSTGFEQISAGSGITCAVKLGAGAYCWGRGGDGALGNGGYRDWATPQAVTAPVGLSVRPRMVQISVADRHACAVTSQGALYCWGNGQLGRIGTALSPVPVRVPAR